jgi:hypothetical protein
MQSNFLKDVFSDKNNILLNNVKSKKYIIPYLGELENNKSYSLQEHIFENSRLFYGYNKIIEIEKDIYIQSEGDVEIFTNEWFIKNIKFIINKYKTIFLYKDIKIFIQIVQHKLYKKKSFIGGFASFNAIEVVLCKDLLNDKMHVKQTIAHEILHLFFPNLNIKDKCCYNEGLLDYLSCYLIFGKKYVKSFLNTHITRYEYEKSLNNLNMIKQSRPYIMGYFMAFLLTQKDIDIIISFIQKYLNERKYMLASWNNKEYNKFIKKIFSMSNFCEQYIDYKF